MARRGARGRGPGGLDVVLGLPDPACSTVAVLGSGVGGLTELSSELEPEPLTPRRARQEEPLQPRGMPASRSSPPPMITRCTSLVPS